MTQKLNPKETAVVLIEFQNDFTSEGGHLHNGVKDITAANKTVENTADLLTELRKKGVFVIHSPVLFSSDYRELIQPTYGILKGVVDTKSFVEGTWGGDFDKRVYPVEGEHILKNKRVLDAFRGTDLNATLKSRGIKNVAIAGYLTNCCVDSTMRTAYEKGYNVYTLTDCTACGSPEEQKIACEKSFPMFSHPTTSKAFATLLA
eukprot:TRINITY_DN1984_c0_g1_i2.p1 TRINITY_DN1984_c0_g1~~TRINITY_DN1984_c0_g1_i2.p1  ORF type:complete len:204 (-),score=55.70 TRINITY_DN1984_c0_g1_i2:53-664(-)